MLKSEIQKTVGFVVVALLLTGAAFLTIPDRSGKDMSFKDQGELFFPNFKDPNACTDLEVTDYDATTASTSEFKVMFKNNKWVIPSHNNYPADAKDRLAKTAGGVVDLTKETIRSDRVEDHEALGVLDPNNLKSGLKGRGKRVTLRDQSEKILADFIIGNPVKDHPDQRYVRVPDQKRVYGVTVKADLSTQFADWIETNLLKIDTNKIRSVKFDHHKVDPDAGKIVPGKIAVIEKKPGAATWTLDSEIPTGEELKTDKINDMTRALGDLKIVGVRPKPEGLSKELRVASSNEVIPTTRSGIQSLVSKGFYPTKNGLFSNQGEVIISTDEGAVYTLRFGEAVFASGSALTAGEDEKEAKKTDEKKTEGTTENRYLMVTVAFDPSLVPEPPKPKEEVKLPDDPFQKAPDDPKRIAEETAAKEKADKEKAAREKQLADAQEKVEELSKRFADWYYVTPGDSFRAISLDKEALVGPKTEKPPTGGPGGPGGFQGLPPGFPNLPPG